ncbi:hypothetical protein [Desulfosporosinus sp. HMP52]|uniref:hypothetical protein n=1 Tax=Desulfosporosinus sp. HMP52 TaxID=1487923 RepID=UPI000A6B53F5|nr:hypothetical protein [Desulfosporosinus sp. HMP52]
MLNTLIFKRNTIYFFTSFIWTATLSVLPQAYFMSNYPEQKNTFLSLFLLLGTLASIGGILTSQKDKFYSSLIAPVRRRNFLTACCIFTMTASFSGLLAVKNLWLYFACFVLLKFISNFFYNCLDRFFVAESEREQLEIHVRSNLFFQLLGIMLAPLYFSCFAANPIQNIILIWTIALLSLLFLSQDPQEIRPDFRADEGSLPKSKLNLYDRLFVAYSALILTAVTMLISMMIYILSDYYQFSNPTAKGGTIIGVISIFAVLTVLRFGFFSKQPIKLTDNPNFSANSNGIATLVLILITLLFYLKISRSFAFLLGGCSLAGISYGIFLFCTRNYASRASANTKINTGLISIYNNLPNYASLACYLLTLSVSLAAKTYGLDFSKLMLKIVWGFFVMALITLYLMRIKTKPVLMIQRLDKPPKIAGLGLNKGFTDRDIDRKSKK